jgi:hypothetical protein
VSFIQGIIFLAVWMLIAVGAPMAVVLAFPYKYPLILLAAAIGFPGGGILAGLLVGFFKAR